MQKGRLLARFFTLMKQKRGERKGAIIRIVNSGEERRMLSCKKGKQWRAKAECIQTWYCYNLR